MKRKIAALVLLLSSGAYFVHAQQSETADKNPADKNPADRNTAITATEVPGVNQESTKKGTGRRYRINNVDYKTEKGVSKAWAIKRNVEIKKDLILESEEDLENQIKSIEDQIENTRLLDINRIEEDFGDPDENGIIPVNLCVTVSDSKHFMAFPKPSYSSNSGAEIKLKLKDSNFLGFMNTLNFDLNAQFGNSDAPTDFSKITLGTNLSYDYPFNVGFTEDTWENDFSFDWEIGEAKPEFSYDTGVTVGIPFGNNRLNINFTQSIVRENDYESCGDDLYFVEKAGMSMPLTLGYIRDVIPVRYTPSVSVKYNWDMDGIEHTDLVGPSLTVNQSLSISNVNWQGNFREGYSASLTHYVDFNFHKSTISPFISMEAQLFKAFKYMGINSKLYVYAVLNDEQNNVGGPLRGILNNQYVDDGSRYALKSDMAIQASLDFPIHIVTTDWCGWGEALFGKYSDLSPTWQKILWLPHKIFQYADFELQVSPFFDMALTHNFITGRKLSYKDGFYDAGLELLIYPCKWKSYVVRTSFGVDVGRLALTKWIDTSWRDMSVKKYELYFGLGLQF